MMASQPPVHPGDLLRVEFLAPLGLSAYRLAKSIGLPVTRVQEIVAKQRGFTGDTALRFARYFGNTPEFWMNVQRDYDLETAAARLGDRLDREVHPRPA